ncbi:hypothetical protein ACFLYV_05695, partial [Chloroflexota bacterium]
MNGTIQGNGNEDGAFGGALVTSDAEAIAHLKTAITSGKHWYLALLGAIGLWYSAAETFHGRFYLYLIDDEAFDWMLLAERICEEVGELLPEDERNNLIFHGRPPIIINRDAATELIGP